MGSPSSGRVAGIMFFQLFNFGAFNPVLSLYLVDYLHFSGAEAGAIMASSIISALIAPMIATFIIDRLVSSATLLLLCHSFLLVLSLLLMSVHGFWPFFLIYIVLTVWSGPTFGLVNAISFQNLKGGSSSFGSVRLWGTIGWIVAGWIVSGLWLLLPMIFRGSTQQNWMPASFAVSALGSLVVVLLAIKLPRKLPAARGAENTGPREFIPKRALAVMRMPGIGILCLVYLLSSILDKFYQFGTAPYLSRQGLPQAWIMPILSLGQFVEIGALFSLSRVLKKLSYRTVFAIGLSAQAIRFVLLMIGGPIAPIFGVSLNGVVFAFAYTAIIMYIDQRCDEVSRGGVHQILNFVFVGVSSVIGNLAAGFLSNGFRGDNSWLLFWGLPAATAVIILLFMLLAFKRAERRPV